VTVLDDRFKARPTLLLPILMSLAFGVLCAFIISASQTELYEITPFQEGVFGSFGNAGFFAVAIGFGASLIYLLLKRKKHKLITLITGLALTTAVFMLSFVYLLATFSTFSFLNAPAVAFVSALFITVLADLAIFRWQGPVCDFVVLCLGGALGTFLGASVPTLSTIAILCVLAVYDVYTVYHGPVGKIAHSGLEQLRGLSFSFRDVQMGLGDLTFYSMLSGHIFLNFGSVSCLASVIGILLGCLIAFKMLEKKRMFPGLPFPIALGLIPLILALYFS
jgi:presenilin-like A22 family membrane protease